MPETRLNVRAAAQAVQLTVEGLAGLTGSAIVAASADGKWKLTVPREAYGNMPAVPGEALVVTISLVRVSVEPVPEPLFDPSTKLILPRSN